MTKVEKERFNAFLNARVRAYPDGFRRVGSSAVQTRWLVDGREVARRTDDQDSGQSFYEILDLNI
ncbi:MAG TPA: hypothetical protein VFJ70_20645 [Burkholderiales bacterium]|nr:hypothetical protein [Burkholderiales bacterium]